ncbi:MAG: class I adenylate-forming enzyme family protein [Parahaliea sp.]
MNPSYPAVGELYAQALNLYTRETAIVDGERRLSYDELRGRMHQLLAAFDKIGLGPGSTLGLALNTSGDFVELVLATYIAGLTLVELNPALPWEMVEHRVRLSGADAVLVRASDYPAETLARFGGLACPAYAVGGEGGDLQPLPQPASAASGALIPRLSDAPGGIYFTSGSTGLPKGFPVPASAPASQALLTMMTVNHPVRPVSVLAMTHPTVMHMLLTPTILRGGCVVTVPSPDLDKVVGAAKANGANMLFMPTRMLYTLLDQGDTDWMKAQLELFYYGGENMTVERLTEAIRICGPIFAQTFGTAESGPSGLLRPEDHNLDTPEILGSLGRPIIGMDMQIRDENGAELPPNQPGYLYIKSPGAMLEYIGQPEKTRDTLIDGWVCPGDVGSKDERGFFYFLDRDTFALKVDGKTLYPRKVEMHLGKAPAIKEVVAMAVEIDGESRLCIAVQQRGGDSLTKEEVAALVDGEYGVSPYRVLFVESIPLNPVSRKLDRPAIEGMFRNSAS